MKPTAKTIKEKYQKFLKKTVGKRPSKKRMKEIDLIMNNLKNKNNILYNKKLAAIWREIVAYESNPREITLFRKHTFSRKNLKVTSIASGLGIFELFIAKEIIPEGKIILIDSSKSMCKKAREYKKKLKVMNAQISFKDANKTGLKKNTQNLVIARRPGFTKSQKWPGILKEVKRILKEDPKSAFIYTTQKQGNKSKKEIIEELDKAGLKLIKIEEFKEMSGTPIEMIIAKVKNKHKD